MTPRDDLHQLIHSLTPAEQRYFKLHARLQESDGEWNYMRLFESIAKQQVYDEGEIKEEFRGTKIGKNLAVEKHYLYMQLLKALRNFRARKRKDMELREMMDGMEILVEKGLEGPAWHLLQRAKKLARKLDQPLELVEIHFHERRMEKMVEQKRRGKSLDEMDGEGQMLVERLRNEVLFHSLYDRFSKLIATSHDLRKASRQETLQRALAHPLLQDDSHASSLPSRSLFHQIKANGAFLLGHTADALHHYRHIAELWRAQPHAIQRYPRRFLRILVNYMTGLENAGHYADIPPILREISAKSRPSSR